MPKPRFFLSSTCYDLNDARANLTTFLEEFGFEVLNSQRPSFGVTPKVHSAQACIEQVELADYFILIIGSRRGSEFPGATQSITNMEFNRAKQLGLVIIPFVKDDLLTARRVHRRNPEGDFTEIVDDKRIFEFIDSIDLSQEDNWLHSFRDVGEIIEKLKSQFSHYLLLYAKYLGRLPGKSFKPTRITMSINGVPADIQVLATEPEFLDR